MLYVCVRGLMNVMFLLLYCDTWSCRCSSMGSISVSSCRCCMFVCILWQLSMLNSYKPKSELLMFILQCY